jgi:hypothetical protein
VEQGVADLRQQVDVLMSVDEIRRAAEGGGEGLHLSADFAHERFAREATHDSMASRGEQRQEGVLAQRREILAERTKRCRERQMQSDRHARLDRIEGIERTRFPAIEARRRHQHRGGVEATTHHEIADRGVDRARNAEIVGAKPDAPRRPAVHSAAERVGGWSAALALPVLSVCSATK